MSEYADIKIKNLSLYWFRNYLKSDIVHLLFSKLDYRCIPDYIDDPDDGDSEKYTKHMYVTTVQKAKERLDALGFSVSRAEHIFDETKYEAIYYDALLSHLHIDYDDYEEKAKKRIEKHVTFRKWKNSLSISPHKDAKRINAIGQELEAEFGVKHLPSDFKKHNGYLRSLQLSEEYGLYRQDYCGCEFSAKARGIEK